MQLFADLEGTFADEYLHHVDSDSVLISEVFNTAMNTCTKLTDIKTPKADHLLDNLEEKNGNISANFNLNESIHTIRLNERVTRRGLIHLNSI